MLDLGGLSPQTVWPVFAILPSTDRILGRIRMAEKNRELPKSTTHYQGAMRHPDFRKAGLTKPFAKPPLRK